MNSDRLLDGRIRMRHLILVTTVAEARSLVGASTVLNVTQPFISRGLQEIESALRVRLFDRGPRGVKPTAEGEIFLEYAWVVLNTLRRAGEHLDEVSLASSGVVTAGANLAAAHFLMPNAFLDLKSKFPTMTVTMVEGSQERLIAQLNRDELDLLVGRLPRVRLPEHRYLPLYDEPMTLVVRKGHPALDHLIELSELLDYPWILPCASSMIRPAIDEIFTASGLPLPRNLIECSTMVTTKPILLASDAIASLPMLVASTDDDLEILPIPLDSIPGQMGIIMKRDAPMNRAKSRLINSLTTASESLVSPLLRPVELAL